MGRNNDTGTSRWVLGAAVAAGTGALVYSVLKALRANSAANRQMTELDRLEDAAVDALRGDPVTGECPIDVAALAPGIIELTGVVPNHDVGQRAARLLHALTGVRTVINRLDAGAIEDTIAQQRGTRARYSASGSRSAGDSQRPGAASAVRADSAADAASGHA